MGQELGVNFRRVQEIWKAADNARDRSKRWAQLSQIQRMASSYANREQDSCDLKMHQS